MSRFVFFSSCVASWGGSEELWAGAAEVLAKGGHAVTVFKTHADSHHPRILRLGAAGCRIRDLYQFCLPIAFRLPKHADRIGELTQRLLRPLIRVLLARLRPDLIVVSQGLNFDGLIYCDLCRVTGWPYVIISQKATDFRWPIDRHRTMMRDAYQAAASSYFVSQHNLRLTESQIGETLGNAEVVRNPFLVSGSALPWPTDDGSTRLACVARLETGEKGQDILLQVLARPRWRNRDVFVSFFGAGDNLEALRRLAGRLLVKNIDFPGFVNDVESVWRTHHALVLPSRTEGLPLALVEAMLCGRFGIVTDEGGSSEVVGDGRTGFIASAAKVEEFDDAMERAWAVRYEWEAIGKAAAAAIKTMVPDDPVATFTDKLLALAESIQARSRNPGDPYAYTHKQPQ